jgi:hypothetical protein
MYRKTVRIKKKHIEQDSQIDLLKWAKLYKSHSGRLIRSYFIGIRNEGKRSRINGYIAKLMGLRAGAFDLFLCYHNDNYHGFFIEMKAPTGKPSKAQLKFKEEVEEEGYKAEFYYNWPDAANAIIEYMNLTIKKL